MGGGGGGVGEGRRRCRQGAAAAGDAGRGEGERRGVRRGLGGGERGFDLMFRGGGCLGIYIMEGGFTWRRDQGIGIGVGKI